MFQSHGNFASSSLTIGLLLCAGVPEYSWLDKSTPCGGPTLNVAPTGHASASFLVGEPKSLAIH